jgi:hypothetical protein
LQLASKGISNHHSKLWGQTMRERRHMLPVWFFIGLLLTIYGVIILATSLRDWSHPPAMVLAQYHPGFWGGILLLLIGGFYTVQFWPRRNGDR